MKLKLFFTVFAIVILVIAVSISIGEGDRANEVVPPNTAGFLSGGWHPAPECVQCHVSLLSKGELRAKLGSCNCHRDAYTTGGKIDMGKISKKAHGIKVCIDCHIGTETGIASTSTEAIPCGEFHKVHENVDCQACHGERRQITIPKSKRCNSCHDVNPHTVHANKTGEMCVICHGAFGKKYKEAGYQLKEGVPVEKKHEETIYPTISNILKALIKFIFR